MPSVTELIRAVCGLTFVTCLGAVMGYLVWEWTSGALK